MSTVTLKNIKKIYPFNGDDAKKSKKKAAEEGKHVGKYAYNEDGTRKRSLHHIDDEDEAETAPAPVAKNEEDDKLAPDVDPADAPVMKDDRGTHYKKKS